MLYFLSPSSKLPVSITKNKTIHFINTSNQIANLLGWVDESNINTNFISGQYKITLLFFSMKWNSISQVKEHT